MSQFPSSRQMKKEIVFIDEETLTEEELEDIADEQTTEQE